MAEPGPPIPYIYNAITEGLNATQALNRFRELGGAIRTQRFYHAFGEVSAELAVYPQLQATPAEQIPSGDIITPRGVKSPGGYIARGGVLVSVRTINQETGQVTESTQINYGSVRMSDLATMEQIMGDLENAFGPEGQSGLANSTVLGSFITGLNELVPYDDEE